MKQRSNRKIPIVNESYTLRQQKQNMQMRRKKKLLIRRLTVFFSFAFIVIFSLVATLNSQKKALEIKRAQLENTQIQYEEIKEKQKILQEEIKKLQDDEYLGKYAREEYFLSDDGEIIFTIPNEENQSKVD